MSNITQTRPSTQVPEQVDMRGPRFVAWVTTAVLVVTLLAAPSSAAAAAVILGVQAVVFAVGAVLGPRKHPYGLVFATLIAPRLGPVTDREPAAPLKFAQLVGLVFAVVGVIAFSSGLLLLGLVATGCALVAALLNAAFGICLGCRLYPLAARLRPKPRASATAP